MKKKKKEKTPLDQNPCLHTSSDRNVGKGAHGSHVDVVYPPATVNGQRPQAGNLNHLNTLELPRSVRKVSETQRQGKKTQSPQPTFFRLPSRPPGLNSQENPNPPRTTSSPASLFSHLKIHYPLSQPIFSTWVAKPPTKTHIYTHTPTIDKTLVHPQYPILNHGKKWKSMGDDKKPDDVAVTPG